MYRDVRLWLTKVGEVIVILGIKRSELDVVRVNGLMCLTPAIDVNPECFVRLCRVHQVVPTIRRDKDFLYGEFRFRGIAIMTIVWSKSSHEDATEHWRMINLLSQSMLEVKRPRIGVKRTAIADKRRLIGLPAPKVVDVH